MGIVYKVFLQRVLTMVHTLYRPTHNLWPSSSTANFLNDIGCRMPSTKGESATG